MDRCTLGIITAAMFAMAMDTAIGEIIADIITVIATEPS